MYHRVTTWSLVLKLVMFFKCVFNCHLEIQESEKVRCVFEQYCQEWGIYNCSIFRAQSAFLAWFMHLSIPAAPIPPRPRLLWGICPSCQPRRGMGAAGIDWCITVMVKENICENIIQLLTPSLWNPGKILGTHTSNIWEFSSSKGIHDSIGVWIPLHGFWNPATGSFVGGTWNWF